MAGGADPEAHIQFLEAAYDWELKQDDTWLRRVVEAAVRIWGRPAWACGFEYDASDVSRFKVWSPVFVDASPLVLQITSHQFSNVPPDIVARTYRKVTAGFGRDINGVTAEHDAVMKQIDTVDFFGVNGLDPSGIGCFVGIGAERATLRPDEVGLYERLSSHLSSAYRCRRRLRETPVNPLEDFEAVLRPDGALLDARGPAASKEARAAIRNAARMRESARAGSDAQEPTTGWRPRVGGRWTLVDADDRGERVVVARENQSQPAGLATLTEREQQVVASAASGRSNKEIAYDLGISDATARVLLSRAYRRLGVRSRDEMFALPAIRRLRGEVFGDD
jgi:DNA-binding CsgD family transcriptional regulator